MRKWTAGQVAILVVIVVAVLGLGIAGAVVAGVPIPLLSPASCADQSKEALAAIQSLAREWDDANKVAGQTPRSNLSGQIAALQAVRRKTQDVVVPECAAPMQRALVESMDATIEGYVAFLGQKSDGMVQNAFKLANEKMDLFSLEVIRLNAP